MLSPRFFKGAFALATVTAALTLASRADADVGHRFVGTVHGGAATEAGGGALAEVRLFDDIAAGAGFDMGVNLKGTFGKYTYYGPQLVGTYRFKFTEELELRPIFGARFPFGLKAQDPSKYTVAVSTPVAFTGGARLAFIFDWFVIGAEVEVTPHGATWTEVATKKTTDTEEVLVRAALVLGVAFGKESAYRY